jgi:hypothetical protein
MQIAHCAQWSDKEPPNLDPDLLYRHYASMEQETEQLKLRKNSMRFTPSTIAQRTVNFSDAHFERDSSTGEVSSLRPPVPYFVLTELVEGIETDWKSPKNQKKNGSVVILDGLSIMTRTERDEVRFAELTNRLRQFNGISVILYEPSDSEQGVLDHRADVVIELEKAHLTIPVPYTIHRLHIRKTRYQEAAIGWHQFKFGQGGGGLEIFPSIHFQVHHPRISERELQRLVPISRTIDTKHPVERSILEKVVGKLDEGHSIALLGPRGSYKTELSVDFLSANEEVDKANPKESLLVSLLGGSPKLEVQCPHADTNESKCVRENCRLCKTHMFGFHQPPGCITPAEFLHKIRKTLLEQDRISRLAFWDLTQLDHRFPLLLDDPMFLPAFLEMLRGKSDKDEYTATVALPRPIESLFMGAGNAKYTGAFSAIADNVVFCSQWSFSYDSWSKIVKPPLESNATGTQGTPPIECVILYVDRTAGRFRLPNKKLFAVSLGSRPGYFGSDSSTVYPIDRVLWKDNPDLSRFIDRINAMQGVA